MFRNDHGCTRDLMRGTLFEHKQIDTISAVLNLSPKRENRLLDESSQIGLSSRQVNRVKQTGESQNLRRIRWDGFTQEKGDQRGRTLR
jgi:hypothetical protein